MRNDRGHLVCSAGDKELRSNLSRGCSSNLLLSVSRDRTPEKDWSCVREV